MPLIYCSITRLSGAMHHMLRCQSGYVYATDSAAMNTRRSFERLNKKAGRSSFSEVLYSRLPAIRKQRESPRNFRIADDTETISLWLNTHVLSTADSAFNRLLSDLNRLL